MMEEHVSANEEAPEEAPGEVSPELEAGTAPGDGLDVLASQATVAQREPLTLSFENLTVHVPGDPKSCCGCLNNPFKNYLQEYLGMSLEETEPFYALNDVSGSVSSGELCLVLGVNETSKTTLLRALSGRLNELDELHGTLSLNGVPLPKSREQGWRKLTPYVSASDASHSPVLTVRETLEFAATCTSAEGDSTHRVNRLLKLLGLDHVADTVVGDENLRGISGGQKRRVTVGEMMTDPAHSAVFCFENITDGLASTDSYSLLKYLQAGCKSMNIAGIVSLLQPSDDMVELFDKLLVLGSEGELTYFGPVSRAILEDVFLDPDDEEPPGSLCDLVLRKSLPDLKGETKEQEVRQKFKESKHYRSLMQDLTSIRTNRKSDNLQSLLPDKKYTTSGWHQFGILCNRRLKLITRNAVTYTRVGIAILFGIIIGSLFGDLGQDMMASLSRTGYIFLNSFLVLMLSSAVVLPEGFRQRPTLFKHRSAEFFSGRIAYLAQVLMDIPLAILEATLLSSISYSWVDMNTDSGAGPYFYFLGCLIGLEFVGQAFGRLLCALFRKQVSANAMSTIVIIGWGTVAGFMPSYSGITWVLRWLSWLTPVSYSFEGMMLNEFAGRELGSVAVGGPSSVQVSPVAGDAWLGNFDIPRVAWGTPGAIMTLNVCMLFLLAVVFDMFGLYYVELTRSWYHNQTRRPQSRVKSLEMAPKESEGEGVLSSIVSNVTGSKASKAAAEEAEYAKGDEANADDDAAWPKSLAVRDLCYHVPFKQQKTRINFQSLMGPCLVRIFGKTTTQEETPEKKELALLENVEARFTQGRMCALMGSSGAGKTTLLDVIAGYKTGGRITGEIMIDGQAKQDKMWKKTSGYAEQSDILNPYLSALETLRFTAVCRLPKNVNRDDVINKVVRLMGLEEWLDVVVGRELEGEGLPKHARKRLTIAVQLVVQPRILFLDEPTTGLGNNAAALVIRSIRRATDELGLITIATIHQPSKIIWDRFDDLLLLAKGGRVAYMGEMGIKSVTVLNHFKKLGKEEPPPSCNPADYVLGALTQAEADVAVSEFEGSDVKKIIHDAVDADLKQEATEHPQLDFSRVNSTFTEIRLVSQRQFITQWRNPSYCFMRLISSVLVSLYMGVLFWGDKTTINGAVFSIGAIFFFVFVLVIPMAASVVPLIEDRAVLYRETVSGTYSRLSYGIGSLLADIPFHILNTILMFVSFYFLVGFRLEADLIGYFLAMLFLSNWVITSVGQLYALASPNEESAHGLAGLSVILSVILMGFLITVNAMPEGWRWAYWGNLFHYILQGFVTNELAGKTYHIDFGVNVSNLIPDAPSNVTNIVLFEPGLDAVRGDREAEAASFLAMVGAAGNGTNPDSSLGDIRNVVKCFSANECMANPPLSVMTCISWSCSAEFEAALESFPFEDVLQCFAPGNGTDPGGNSTDPGDNSTDPGTNETAGWLPSDFTIESFEVQDENLQWETILCLIRAILPPEVIETIKKIVEFIAEFYDVILVILDILEKGINLPGELILFFFGWAELGDDGFTADKKWFYCLTSVVVFLAFIEMFKLIAVRYIVWTKR